MRNTEKTNNLFKELNPLDRNMSALEITLFDNNNNNLLAITDITAITAISRLLIVARLTIQLVVTQPMIYNWALHSRPIFRSHFRFCFI